MVPEIKDKVCTIQFVERLCLSSASAVRLNWGIRLTTAFGAAAGAISPASIVASLAISWIVCIGTYSILCDFGADTSFYAYIGI